MHVLMDSCILICYFVVLIEKLSDTICNTRQRVNTFQLILFITSTCLTVSFESTAYKYNMKTSQDAVIFEHFQSSFYVGFNGVFFLPKEISIVIDGIFFNEASCIFLNIPVELSFRKCSALDVLL